jgi:type IV fimbrial biogenesis protein FimT
MQRHANGGFTLIELMITITVGAILLAAAAPGFQAMVRNNRLTTQANTFVSSLQYARSEAVRLRTTVSLRPVDDADWSRGWSVWADPFVRDLNRDGDTADAGENKPERELRTVGAMEGGNSLAPPGGLARIEFLANGFVGSTGNGDFFLCHASGLKGRQMTLSLTGQVTTNGEYVCP